MQKKQESVQKQQKFRTAQPNLRTTAKSTAAVDSTGLLALQAQIGNAAVQRLLAQVNQQTLQRETDEKPPSAIGYVGLNPQARKEANALKRGVRDQKRSDRDQVIISLDDLKEQAVLQTPEGKMHFVEHRLGIPWPGQMAKFFLALACLEKCDPAFCDQMADMMEMFWNAENGKYQLERLVLSGHHAGGEMWGDYTGKHEPGAVLLSRDLPNLAAAFPDAAAQVEDIMFSACNSKEQVELCKGLFPNLKSVWIYEGYSPTVKQGSAQHITQWERKTRGDQLPRRRDKLGNAEIWTSAKGFLVEPGKPTGE